MGHEGGRSRATTIRIRLSRRALRALRRRGTIASMQVTVTDAAGNVSLPLTRRIRPRR